MNAIQIKDKITKIKDEEIEHLEIDNQKEVKIDGDFFENATLNLYYDVISAFISKIIAGKDKPETFIFIDNCLEKEGIVEYDGLELITSSPYLHRISATEFPKLHGKTLIKELFTSLLESHPYSVLFSKTELKSGYSHELYFHLTSNRESLKTFSELISKEDIELAEQKASNAILKSYEAEQKDTSYKKHVKTMLKRMKI